MLRVHIVLERRELEGRIDVVRGLGEDLVDRLAAVEVVLVLHHCRVGQQLLDHREEELLLVPVAARPPDRRP